MNIFEKGLIKHVRFSTTKGDITTEDLLYVPLSSASSTSLDDIAKGLNEELNSGESFVGKRRSGTAMTELKFEIVKRVIEMKLEAIKAKETRAANKAEQEELIALINEKDKDTLKSKSSAVLKKRLAALQTELD